MDTWFQICYSGAVCIFTKEGFTITHQEVLPYTLKQVSYLILSVTVVWLI